MTNTNTEIDSAARNVNNADESVKAAWPAVANGGDAIEITKVSSTEVVQEKKEPLKVVLWTVPRSLSTAFERCMTNVPNSKIFNEMYAAAFLLGPDRKVRWWPSFTPKHSYKYCKKRMERDLSDFDFVFAKDFASGMHHHTDMLPKGYQHTFLVRHPQKVFISLRKTLCSSKLIRVLSMGGKIKNCFPSDGYMYEDMWELYRYLRDNPDYPVPIILDADDIIRDPEAMVKKYCEFIGLTFNPDILKWDKAELSDLPWEGPNLFRWVNRLIGCYNNALNSTGFKKPQAKKKSEGGRVSPAGEAVSTDKVEEKGTTANGAAVHAPVATFNDGKEDTPSNHCATQNMTEEPGVSRRASDEPPDIDYTIAMHPDVLNAVEYTMPFYKKLFAQRVVLDKIPRISHGDS